MHDINTLDSEAPAPGHGNPHLVEPASVHAAPHLLVLTAFLAFTFVDVVVHTLGFAVLRRRLGQCAVRRSRTDEDAEQSRVLSAIDQAAMYYPYETKCLHRSLVAAWLLRRHGVSAQLVIGCRHTPFYGHAWVEVKNVVVNDKNEVKSLYPELERI
jgi:hypothetical protein